ncbi:MAG TPA: hypothetical protein VE442_19525 [Jatrophihabitans sp.]|nr:hypothetical protein [Jatrophihabitans sp.]
MKSRTSNRERLRALAAITGLTAAVLATLTAPPAGAAPAIGSACPAAYPIDQLSIGQHVSGLTVSSGTTPDEFTGNVLGVVDGGIAPGIDMIIVQLSSPAIDNAGIWAGMSGSPVYADDGTLIGAVSYGLTYEASPVAGVTPAADMQALLGGGAASSTAKALADSRQVALPQRMQQRLVTDGLATQNQAQAGLTRLPLPLGVSGAVSINRLNKAESRLHGPSLLGQRDVLVYKTNAAPSAPADGDAIFEGSNLAASISDGDLTAAAIGTTTMVCDGQAVGFGHPFNFTGDSTMTMHGADAITVLKDDIGGSYKLANLTGATGEITGDHLAGITGPLDEFPDTALVESNVTDVSTGKTRTGDTDVSLPDYLPDVALFAEVNNQDVVIDRVGAGSSLVHFTVDGTAGGVPFTLVRTNRFASSFDISFESVFEMYEDLYKLINNKFSDVTIDSVRITTEMDKADRAFSVGKVERKAGTRWVTLNRGSLFKAKAGSTVTLRVTLNSRRNQFGTKVETVSVKVPDTRKKASFGDLSVGNLQFSSGRASSFDDLVTKLGAAPRNDQVRAQISLFSRRGSRHSAGAPKSVGDVVHGARSFQLFITH